MLDGGARLLDSDRQWHTARDWLLSSDLDELRTTIGTLARDLANARGAVSGVIVEITKHREELLRFQSETAKRAAELRNDFLDLQKMVQAYEQHLAQRLLSQAEAEAAQPTRPGLHPWSQWIGLAVVAALVFDVLVRLWT